MTSEASPHRDVTLSNGGTEARVTAEAVCFVMIVRPALDRSVLRRAGDDGFELTPRRAQMEREAAILGRRGAALADDVGHGGGNGRHLDELAFPGAIGAGLGVAGRSVSAAEAPVHLGAMAHFTEGLIRRRALVGWPPTHADLLADLGQGHCFAA